MGNRKSFKRVILENSVNVEKQPPEMLQKKLDEMG